MQISKSRILYAEDDVDTVELVTLLLSKHNCEVVSAATYEQALAYAMAGGFDLYLLDNWLSDSSGIQLCETIRGFDPSTPILFYSGAAFEKDKQYALACGAQGYLTKPATPDELTGEIFRLIRTVQT